MLSAGRRALGGSGRRVSCQVILILVLWASHLPTTFAQTPVQEAIRERVEQLRAGRVLRVGGVTLSARTLIGDFYEARAFEPVWRDAAHVTALIEAVNDSTRHGLAPSDYGIDALVGLAAADGNAVRGAERDLLCTEALIRLAYHLRFGKVDPRQLYRDWNYSRTLGRLDPRTALQALITAPDMKAAVGSYAPRIAAYHQLQAALERYRAIEAKGGWPRVGAGTTLRPGQRDPRVAALRTRLDAEGFAPGPTPADPDLFDDAVASALATFQRQHGLQSDGHAGRQTIEALDVGISRRIEQLWINLERLRWVAADLGDDYLLVDIAGFEASLTRGGQVTWTSPVVVGRPYRRTPSFRATLRYLVINPTWTVPPTILREDVLPKLAADPNYLARHHLRALDPSGAEVAARDINAARIKSLQFVQPPGPDNPLGRLKFMMPNPYSVYLHDTPSRAPFDRSSRAFSSGCIRLARPRELAVQLLEDPAQWSAPAIEESIATGHTRTVFLKRPIEVLLLYFTARAGPDGRVAFRPDLYDRDAEVAAAMTRGFSFRPVDRIQDTNLPEAGKSAPDSRRGAAPGSR